MGSEKERIYLVSEAGAAWAGQFREALRGRYEVAEIAPDGLQKGSEQSPPARGVVVFYEGDTSDSSTGWFSRIRACVRYMDLPLVAVTSKPSTTVRAQLLAAGASAVCDADAEPERIVKEVENRCNVEPVVDEIRERLLNPFIESAVYTVREMTGVTSQVHSVYGKKGYRIFGDHSAIVGLMARTEGTLILSFVKATSFEIGRRILGPLGADVNEDLVQSCIAELANITVGQAKGRLAGTEYGFSMSTPTVVSGDNHEIRYKPGLPCLVALFTSALGDFALQLSMAY